MSTSQSCLDSESYVLCRPAYRYTPAEAGMRGGHRGNALERSEARAPARVRKKLPISNRKYQFKIRVQVRQLQAGTAQKMSNWTCLD